MATVVRVLSLVKNTRFAHVITSSCGKVWVVPSVSRLHLENCGSIQIPRWPSPTCQQCENSYISMKFVFKGFSFKKEASIAICSNIIIIIIVIIIIIIIIIF